ncbi:MAG: response regulator [Actinomycetota bacterium]
MHAFEPFFTTKSAGKGTGLGLATVYGIVKQAKGCIDVETRPTAGTTVRVYLPASAARDATEGQLIADKPRERGSGETVLVAEDEAAVRRVVERILKGNGYTVISSGSPLEAVDLARREASIRLLVTDVVTPEMSGRDLCEQVSAFRRDLKTLFMSGYPDRYLDEPAALSGRSSFLQKPFTPEDLLLKVRELLES